ncbi:MAG: tRNA uridine-5-carboxymethylaminomethyl(34) synthesis GTPase MnmE [Deltaproteobacteria bacterium]
MAQISLADEKTIAALATPAGRGGIAVIRMSGRESHSILARVFRRKDGGEAGAMESRRLYYGAIFDSVSGRTIDDVLAVIMKSPRSYTGEDVAEIHSHGGILAPNRILELLFREGTRPASPGEFTLRAYLSGRIDLAQAEAVADVISSETDDALKNARLQLEGALSEKIRECKEGVIDILAEVEARVDFPEEGIDPIALEYLVRKTREVIGESDKLIAGYEHGRIIKRGVSAAIIGKPNVGKSSLLNQLLNRERAIVSPVPGTTRDFIEEPVEVRGIPLRLVDTAGVRATADDIERTGVLIAKQKAEEAELIIAVVDARGGLDGDDREVLEGIELDKAILAINKCDLGGEVSEGEISRYFPKERVVRVSAKTGAGIEELKDRIYDALLGGRKPQTTEGAVISELRHKSAIERAKEGMISFLERLDKGQSPEFLAVDLRAVLDDFGEITGEITTEDILGRIFSKFCVGK